MRKPDDSFLGFLRGLGRRGLGWAVVLLVTGIVTTVQLARHERADADVEAAREFESGTKEIQAKIAQSLATHEQVLRSAGAFFTASEHVTRAEWHAYVERQRIHQNLVGLQGIGFAAVVPLRQLASHLQEFRAAGFPDYRIWPAGERETYSSVIFIEPFSGRNLRAFGYDMLTEPVRRAAMERARDQDMTTLSGKVRLVQETDEDVQAGTLMYVPVYRSDASTETLDERRAALVGWVYSPYRMNDLIVAGMLGRWDLAEQRRFRLEIFDGETPSAEALLYDSLKPAEAKISPATALRRQTVVDLFGRRWLLRFTPAGLASVADYRSTWIVFCSGTLTSLLLAGLAFSLTNTRFNARMMAERLTADLRRSEERWAFAAEGSGDGMWDWDMSTGEVIFSKRWKEMLGYAEHEIGSTVDEWIRRIHPDDLASAMADTQAHLDAKTASYLNEHRVRCKDGSWKWILDRGLVVSRDAGGKPLRMIGTHSDISARKQAEAALRESEESYRLLFAGMLDGFALHEIICDAGGRPVDYRFLSVNPAFERLTGLRAANLIGHTVLEVLPGTEAIWIERYGRVALTGEGVEFEEHSAALDRYFEVAAFRPRPGQFATVFIDVTASKRAERALRESEERYRALVEWSPEAIIVHRNGKFVYGNPAAVKMIGATSATELVDQTLFDRIHPDFHSLVRERAKAMAEGQAALPTIEMKFIRLDGTTIDVETQSTAITFNGVPALHVSARDITARKRAEVALQRSEERYRSILNASPDDITITDPAGRITMISPAAYTMFGYDREAVFLHRSIHEFIAPEDRERASAQLALKAQGIATGPGVYRGRRRDGSTFDIEVNSDFIRDEAGQPNGIVFVVRDITERKQAERALRESEARFRNLLRDIPGVAVQGYALDGTTTYWNAASEQLYGYTSEEAVGRSLLDLIIPPEMAEGVRQAMAHMAATEEPIPAAELLLRRKDGSRVPVFSSHSIVQDSRGAAELFCVDIDLTARKQAEAALRASEERFRVLFVGAPDAMVLADPATGLVLDANDAAGRLLGRPRSTLVGQHQSELHPPRRRDFSQATFGEHAVNAEVLGQTDPVETTVVRPDGTEIPVEVLAQTIRLRDQPTIVGTFRDITVRKQAEADLQSSQEILRGVLNTIPARVFWKDKHLVYLGCNLDFAHDAGFAEPQDLVGKDDFQMGWRNEAELYRADDRQVIASGIPKLFIEETQTNPEGKTIVILTSKVPLRSATGEITGLLGTYTDITQWKLSEMALRTSLRDKEALLKEVHHRVKNNLQVIMSLLRLESRRSVQPDTKSVLGEMQGRIRSMALLHESLYRSGTFAAVDLGSYLKQLATQSFRTHTTSAGRVQLHLELASVEAEMDQALPCGLLVNELLSNALKHGFPAGRTGDVRVELQPVAGGPQWRLRVSDTGVGLPADFEARRTESLGLQLVADLTAQLRGTLEIASATGGSGAVFTATFPLDLSKSSALPA